MNKWTSPYFTESLQISFHCRHETKLSCCCSHPTVLSPSLHTLGKIQFVCNTVNIQIISLPFKYARSTSLGNGYGSLVLAQTVREYEMLTWIRPAAADAGALSCKCKCTGLEAPSRVLLLLNSKPTQSIQKVAINSELWLAEVLNYFKAGQYNNWRHIICPHSLKGVISIFNCSSEGYICKNCIT